ncbi:MAG: hypothetical protein V3V99_03135 [candidate division Zixibacteria bacterium]
MRKLFFLPILCVLIAFSGCGEKNIDPVSPAIENPEIVPEDVLKIMEQYVPDEENWTENSLDASGNITETLSGDYDIYSVTLLWGNFMPGTDIDNALDDWSGSLSFNGVGEIKVSFLIDFERGQDELLFDNIPTSESWVSYTGLDLDGISFLVFFDKSVYYFAAPILTFKTEQITLEFPFEKLAKLDAYYPTSNSGGVGIHSRLVWDNNCQGGLMEGKWIKESFGSGKGRIEALWIDRFGEPFGYFTGMFWTDDSGRGRFFGSVSGYITDHVIAEVKGCWYYDDLRLCPMCGESHGVFMGYYRNIMDGTHGNIAGEFGDMAIDPTILELPLSGIWKQRCRKPSHSFNDSEGVGQ